MRLRTRMWDSWKHKNYLNRIHLTYKSWVTFPNSLQIHLPAFKWKYHRDFRFEFDGSLNIFLSFVFLEENEPWDHLWRKLFVQIWDRQRERERFAYWNRNGVIMTVDDEKEWKEWNFRFDLICASVGILEHSLM